MNSALGLLIVVILLVSAKLLSTVFAKIFRRIEGDAKEVVPAGASKLGEMLVETRDVQFKGFVAHDAFAGKLVLTTGPLVYCRPNETKIALVLQRADVLEMRVGKKGLIAKSVTLEMSYLAGPKRKRRSASFVVHAGSHAPEAFAAMVGEWKQAAA
jgi:hypothetical protein